MAEVKDWSGWPGRSPATNSLISGHGNLFALTVLTTSGSLSQVTNAFAPLPPTASRRSKPAVALSCPTLTSLSQFTTVLAQVTGEYGVENKEVLQVEDVEFGKGWGSASASGHAHRSQREKRQRCDESIDRICGTTYPSKLML